MRWQPTSAEKVCPATNKGHTVGDEIISNTVHCHPRQKSQCVDCGQTIYTIAMDHVTFDPDWYTMPSEVWSSRGISEALRTQKQWKVRLPA